nr:MAG TPA: hypothetical protein [Caudoviricetes sp.]
MKVDLITLQFLGFKIISCRAVCRYAKCSESAQSHPKIDFFRGVQLENRNSCYICSRNPPNRACNSACWKPLKISVAVLKRVTG